MIYIAVTPAWVYAMLLFAALAHLTRTCKIHAPGHVATVLPLYIVTLGYSIFAFAALWLTAQYSISKEACMTGTFGFYSGSIVVAISALMFGFLLLRRTPVFTGDKKVVFAVFLCVGLACLTCLRSALLCTV